MANPKQFIAILMTTSAIIISILFVICLTSGVGTRSLGLVRSDDKPSQRFTIPMLFGLSQGVMAVMGYYLGKLVCHLFVDEFAPYVVFAMMLVVAARLFIDAIRMLKGKMLFTVMSERDFILLSIMAAFNVFLMSLMGSFFMPFGVWFFPAVAVAGFLWAFFMVRADFAPTLLRKASFAEFSASVFMVVIAVLYLFTDLLK